MPSTTYQSPREAAAAVIEINKAYKQKLSKAATKIREKNALIMELQQSQKTIDTNDTDYIEKLEQELNAIRQENEALQRVKSENELLKEQNKSLVTNIENLKNQLESPNGTTQNSTNQKQETNSAKDVDTQLCLASLHIAGLNAEVKAFKVEHSDSKLLEGSEMFYEDGRPKSNLRVIYEDGFDRRANELNIENPKQLRPK